MDKGTNIDSQAGVTIHRDLQSYASVRSRWALAGADKDWLCALCHHRLASDRDRLQFGNRSEFAFTNPDGMPFLIVTFSEATGCLDAGDATLEHTWFPGHAWSYCLCGHCGQHLGWFYTGSDEFVGLIQTKIIRALNLFN